MSLPSDLAQLVRDVAETVDPVGRYRRAEDLISELSLANQELQGVKASAATELHAAGHSYREIGVLLGISAQRVGQLVNTSEGLPRLLRAWNELERKLALLGSYRELPTDRRSSERLVSALVEAGDLTPEEATQLDKIRQARNDAAHARRLVSDAEVDSLLDEVIVLSAQLELAVSSAHDSYEGVASRERLDAEALLRRVVAQYPDTRWYEGRCDECGRAIPVPSVDDLWVCTAECRKRWMAKLYHFVDPGSEEETMTRTPRLVPYWL